jgi:hypothetical protein
MLFSWGFQCPFGGARTSASGALAIPNWEGGLKVWVVGDGIPKKEILMAYIINILMPENPEKSQKNDKNYQKRKF